MRVIRDVEGGKLEPVRFPMQLIKQRAESFNEYCPKCNNIIEGEDPKGNGVHIEYYCEECEEVVTAYENRPK